MHERESYIVPGVVDGSVLREQADKRRRDKRHPEGTMVHDHKYGEPCTEACTYYSTEEQN